MGRAVHGLLSVAMLAGAVAAVMSDASDVASREARCQVWRAAIHATSDSTSYAAVSAANLGSVPWASESSSFAGDGGAPARLAAEGPAPAGGSWRPAGPVAAQVSPGAEYLVLVSAGDGFEALHAPCARQVGRDPAGSGAAR